MMKIGKTIIEPGITKVDKLKKRITVRGVILNDNNEILMLYSAHFNDYTFPGGGVKNNEDKIQALKRELLEEIGAINVEITNKLGHISEVRYGISGSNSLYKQTSYYYLCNNTIFGETNHVGREKEQGLKAEWINIDKAIKHNEAVHKEERQYKKGLKTVLLRENEVLNYIRELINAKI